MPPPRGQPPTLLAGPILRRVSPQAAWIWLATETPADASAELYDPAASRDSFVFGAGSPLAPPGGLPAARIGGAAAAAVERVQVGRNLFVHLLKATADAGVLPVDRLLAYDVKLDGHDLASLGAAEAVAYPQFRYPTFHIAGRLERVLHGSCRKPHGGGADAFANADDILGASLEDLARRPAALFLTGDQIYADDVDRPVARAMERLARRLQPFEALPRPHVSRRDAIKGGLTSSHSENHALLFGEYAALYLLAWNGDHRGLGAGEAYDASSLAGAMAARRVLANVPTYMLFDDHDVTDDWFLNADWKKRALKDPNARRIVANGLAAYWAFQGWGNAPEAFDEPFKRALARHLAAPGEDTAPAYEAAVLERGPWSYVTPTEPLVLALDTRTHRGEEQGHLGAVELVSPAAYRDAAGLLARAGHKGGPLVLLSPAPVLGHPRHEAAQEVAPRVADPYVADTESWTAHRAGRANLARFLMRDLKVTRCVVLSGDVHYGYNGFGEFQEGGRSLLIAQLTSSALRNADSLTQGLSLAQILLPTDPIDEVGWRHRREHFRTEILPPPPYPDRDFVLPQRRAVPFDEPLVLDAGEAAQRNLPPPDWRLRWRLEPLAGGPGARNSVVGDTNLGDLLLDLPDGRVVHTLWTRAGGRRGSGRATARIALLGSGPVWRRPSRQSRSRPAGDPSDRYGNLALHMLRWRAGNQNEDWGKKILPFADFRLEELPRQLLPGGRGDHIKTQMHSITFELQGGDVAGLGRRLAGEFDRFLPPEQATIRTLPALPLAVGSEIRWQVTLFSDVPAAQAPIEELMRRVGQLTIDPEARRFIRQELNRALSSADPSRRRFDVRVSHARTDARGFLLKVDTLANHPYGGTRAWRIRAHQPGYFSLETVELNSYAFLPDTIFEFASDADKTKRLWVELLTRFLRAVGGRQTVAADPAVAALSETPPDEVAQRTEFLVPETLPRSALAAWIRRDYPEIDAVAVAAGF